MRWISNITVVMLIGLSAGKAHSADGCKFLLCIAGPWQNIAECRPTVHEVFRDLALGRSFPTCEMAGEGNSASNAWLSELDCPMMYRRYDHDGMYSGCTYTGRINVFIDGALWSQVFWNTRGQNSTWYSDAAREGLTSPGGTPIDETFQTDLAAWNGVNVPQCTAGGGTPIYGAYGAYESCSYPDWGGG